MGIGPWQLILILVVVVLVFGAKRLPDTARALGKSMRILKSETAALRSDDQNAQGAGQEDADRQTQPRPIQAAPGDGAGSQPAEEPRRNAQG